MILPAHFQSQIITDFVSVGTDIAESTGHVDATLPESTICRSSRHPTARSISWSCQASVHECRLAPQSLARLKFLTNLAHPHIRSWRFCNCEHKTHNVLDLNITNKLNALTFETKTTQRALSRFLTRRSSMVLWFPVCGAFSLPFPFFFSFFLGLGVTLPFSAEFVHSRMSLRNGSCGGLLFVYSCRQHHAVYPPKRLCSPRSGWNQSPCACYLCPGFSTMFSAILLSLRAFSNWNYESILTFLIT